MTWKFAMMSRDDEGWNNVDTYFLQMRAIYV